MIFVDYSWLMFALIGGMSLAAGVTLFSLFRGIWGGNNE